MSILSILSGESVKVLKPLVTGKRFKFKDSPRELVLCQVKDAKRYFERYPDAFMVFYADGSPYASYVYSDSDYTHGDAGRRDNPLSWIVIPASFWDPEINEWGEVAP